MVNQPEIHAGRLLPGAVLAFSFIVAVNYFVESSAFMSICKGVYSILFHYQLLF